MIRVLLADHRRLTRAGLKRLIEEEGGIRIVAEAENGDQAIGLACEHKPHVTLVETRIREPGVLETVRRLAHLKPKTRVMAVGDADCGPLPVRILELGALGYLSKHADGAEVRQALRTLHAGGRYVSDEPARHLVFAGLDRRADPVGVLSPRELSVMLMLSEGHLRDEISSRLCISPKTVSTYRTRLLQKLGARHDVDLAHLAFRHGLLEPQARAGA